MKIYIAHSQSFDFKTELYIPIKNSPLSKEYSFVFPHELMDERFNSKDFLKNESTPFETVHDQYLEILKEEEKIIERKIEILNELQKLNS